MKNKFFNISKMRKYAEDKSFDLTVSKFDIIKKFVEKVENGEFSSEESNYPIFDDFLKDVLDYSRDDIKFQKKFGKGKADYALAHDDEPFMICELKDQNTDLDKPQNRAKSNESPVEQALRYTRDPEKPVDWVLVSNFKEFRLYNFYEREKCLCFSYKDLLNKKCFRLFMVAFSKYSHVDKGYPDKLLKESLFIERNMEKNFYKLFHETRLMLIKELEFINDFSRKESIHYAQKILNRYMFISFAEDTDLLPGETLADTILTPIEKGNIEDYKIWGRINELFGYLINGNKFKKIPGYNGGLFEENLCSFKIRDIVEDQSIFQDTYQDWEYEKEVVKLPKDVAKVLNPIYKNLLTISSYDFSTDLNVNILGHIFENSIGDIEELKDDTQERRKKDGIFYTPDYITDYICRNTIIPYLSRSGSSNNINDLIAEYSWSRDIEDLDEKLKNIKIVDPACGSGAFLNKATDILLEIHQAVYDFKKGYTKSIGMRVGKGKGRRTESVQHLDMDAYLFDHIKERRKILLNNIYGVDLNEESVEITKLSLFLKVCREDLKLPNLDNNIRNGNSLIDDPEFTDKAFNWEEQFPEIFNDGKFDIIIGNPPYISTSMIDESERIIFRERFKTSGKEMNTFSLFMEKSLNLISKGGMLSFIIPDSFLTVKSYIKIRKLFLTNTKISKIVNIPGGAFEDAELGNSTIIAVINENDENLETFVETYEYITKTSGEKVLNKIDEIDQKFYEDTPENMFYIDIRSIQFLKKLKKGCLLLSKIAELKDGIKTGNNKKFVSDTKISDLYKKLLIGKDIFRYRYSFNNRYVLYDREILSGPRQERIFLAEEKIITRQTGDRIIATYDDNQYYTLDNTHIILPLDDSYSMKYILSLLNSNLINYYYKLLVPETGRTYAQVRIVNLEKLPIYPATPEQQQPLIKKADQMLKLNNAIQKEIKEFHDWLQHTFSIEKLSNKLDKYYELDLEEFLVEVRKKKVDVKSRSNYQTLKIEFEESLAVIKPLLSEIQDTDDQINKMVYELYELTEEEIEIIENSLN